MRTSAAALGVEQFKLADIGEGIAEVQLTEWFVKEGDSVKEMDNVCAVESDKASVELTSPFTGKVKKVHYKVSDTVKVGSILVEIETAGAAPAPAPSPSPAPTPTCSFAQASVVHNNGILLDALSFAKLPLCGAIDCRKTNSGLRCQPC